MKTFKLALVVAVGLLTSGCSEANQVTVYEPGVYKGTKDDLLAKADTANYDEQMRQRFERGQTDRQNAVESGN